MTAQIENRILTILQAGDDLAKWAEEARGYYGIEAESGTEWDDVQDGLRDAAAKWRAVAGGAAA